MTHWSERVPYAMGWWWRKVWSWWRPVAWRIHWYLVWSHARNKWRASRCTFTGGHEWGPILMRDLPQRDDMIRYSASTQCKKCRQFLMNQGGISGRINGSANMDALAYHRERMVRELLVATANKAIPIYYSYEEWERHRWMEGR